MRTIRHIKHASGLTTNTKQHLAEKANHAIRFAAYINGKLVPVSSHKPVIAHSHAELHTLREKAALKAEFDNPAIKAFG